MVNVWAAILLGAIQGLTEFLPVSSTAHLLLLSRVIGFDDPGDVFKITIQLGSILAFVWLYRLKLLSVLVGVPTSPRARHFVLMIAAAFVPAAVVGLVFADFVKGVLYQSPTVIALAFVIGGVVMLVVERFRPEPLVRLADETPLPRAVGIGLWQTLALIPGVSRSGATIVGGLVLRLDRPAAAEFSFFLAMPVMAGAFVHEIWSVRDHLAPERAVEIALGFVMAFLAALVVVRPFLRFVGRAGFAPFAWYRIAAGALILAAVSAGWI